MNKQNQKSKLYPDTEYPAHEAREPEMEYQTVASLSFDEDFDRAWARRITMEDLRQHLYRVIDSWSWEKQ